MHAVQVCVCSHPHLVRLLRRMRRKSPARACYSTASARCTLPRSHPSPPCGLSFLSSMKFFFLFVAAASGFSAVPGSRCADAAPDVVASFLHDRFVDGVPHNASMAMVPYMHNSCHKIASDDLCTAFGVEQVCCATCTELRQARGGVAYAFWMVSDVRARSPRPRQSRPRLRRPPSRRRWPNRPRRPR